MSNCVARCDSQYVEPVTGNVGYTTNKYTAIYSAVGHGRHHLFSAN